MKKFSYVFPIIIYIFLSIFLFVSGKNLIVMSLSIALIILFFYRLIKPLFNNKHYREIILLFIQACLFTASPIILNYRTLSVKLMLTNIIYICNAVIFIIQRIRGDSDVIQSCLNKTDNER